MLRFIKVSFKILTSLFFFLIGMAIGRIGAWNTAVGLAGHNLTIVQRGIALTSAQVLLSTFVFWAWCRKSREEPMYTSWFFGSVLALASAPLSTLVLGASYGPTASVQLNSLQIITLMTEALILLSFVVNEIKARQPAWREPPARVSAEATGQD